VICKSKAYIWSARGIAFDAWKNLKDRYHEVNEDDLVELNEKFADCKVEDEKDDPKVWCIELMWWHVKIAEAGG
jgi:hypothetical protein